MTAKWGLVPSWAKDPSIGHRMINARSETVADKPAFRTAFEKRRAIVPADGFYEWYQPEVADGEKRPPKQPFYMSAPGGLGLAGLYEFWKDAEGQWLLTYTILTTSAEGEDGRIHDRAPLLVTPTWPSSGSPRSRGPTPSTVSCRRPRGPADLAGDDRGQQRAQQRTGAGRADPGRAGRPRE